MGTATMLADGDEYEEEKTVRPSKSKSLLLAEDLVISAGDSDATTDEAVLLPFGKPNKMSIFRIHPQVRGDVRLLKMKEDVKDAFYIVTKPVAAKLDYIATMTVFLGAYQDNTNFFWAIGTGDDTWSSSARRIAADAMKEWVRVVSKKSAGLYIKRSAKHYEQEPEFNGLDSKPFSELLMMAFDDEHIISDLDHPVAQQVRND